MKILLLNPPSPTPVKYIRVDRCMQKNSSWAGTLWPPLPLLYIQSVLTHNGYEAKTIDAVALNYDHEKILRVVDKEKPDFIVINTGISSIKSDLSLSLEIKKHMPQAKIIVCGVPVTLMPRMVASFGVDYAVRGDPEYAVLDIIRNKFKYKKINKTKFVEKKVKNLDDLPFPQLTDLNLDDYKMPFTRERLMIVNPIRGCPYKCIFCFTPFYSRGQVRYRSPKNFVDEIQRDHEEYKINNFIFWSETTTLDKKWMEEVSDEIIARNLKIRWMTPTRITAVDKKLLMKMKKAGCWLIAYGIECYDQHVLNTIKKNQTTKQIKKAIKMTKDVGIKIVANIILGLPGQTKKSFINTINFLVRNDVDYMRLHCATPFWGTELRKIAQKNGWIELNEPEFYETDIPTMRNEFLTTREIKLLREYAYLKFYYRLDRIFKELIGYIFKPFAIFGFFFDALYFIKKWINS